MIGNKKITSISNSMFKCFCLFLCGMACVACNTGETGDTGSVTSVKILNARSLDTSETEYELKLLGKYVFFDRISEPQRMACVSCHDPEAGGTGSVSGVNLHQVAITGANPLTLGNLKPPTNAYASFIGPFHSCDFGGARPQYCGGNFWDGRAEGRSDGEGGAIFAGATDHIGTEVFDGIDPILITSYTPYLGPTSDQALNPMPNPVEQNIKEKAVCQQVAESQYAQLYELAWGVDIDCTGNVDVVDNTQPFYISFKRLMLAVGAWQHTKELNSFSSKRDMALQDELDCLNDAPNKKTKVCDDEDYLNSPGTFPLVGLTDQENLGHDLFYNTLPVPFAPTAENDGPPFNVARFPGLPLTNCSFCHSDNPGPVGPGPRDNGSEPLQLYADDAYHNIGTPANPELPADRDPGLAAHTGIHEDGFFKTPTLRNVDKRPGKGFIKAYAHNGWFKSLESIVHFYNTAFLGDDTTPYEETTAYEFGITPCEGALTEAQARELDDDPDIDCWPAPEWPDTASPPALVGDIGMSAEQEAALVAYLKTLTDTVTAEAPAPYVTVGSRR